MIYICIPDTTLVPGVLCT